MDLLNLFAWLISDLKVEHIYVSLFGSTNPALNFESFFPTIYQQNLLLNQVTTYINSREWKIPKSWTGNNFI